MLYIVIVSSAVLIISAIITLVTSESFFAVLGLTCLAVGIVLAINGLTATVCRLLPKKCANHEKRVFSVSAREKRFYEKLQIRNWKDKIPEIGQFTGFRKNKLADPKSLEYIDRFLLEICYGELGHIASVFTSFLLLLFGFISPLWIAIALPVSLISAIMNLPSLFILRYNYYKLKFLRKNLIKRQAKENA